MKKPAAKPLLSSTAKWIWDGSSRSGYHYYLEAQRIFSASRTETATLLVTADAYYQVWLNGNCFGHGPAKSAESTRSVDCYDVSPFLCTGENTLDFLVMSMGAGTMTYRPGEAGLLFELRLDSRRIVSDSRVRVRRPASRMHPTVRRWILPCLEHVNAYTPPRPWKPARIVAKTAMLYPRRVPLPSRVPVYLQRIIRDEQVELPNFSVSFRIKPALVDLDEQQRGCNGFSTPASLRVPIYSPRAQTLHLTPTLGQVAWSFEHRGLFRGSGWDLRPAPGTASIQLKAGRNELMGRHGERDCFEDVSLAGFTEAPIKVGAMEVVRDDGGTTRIEPMLFANGHDLAVGARVVPGGTVRRTILDLGCVYNGWIAFQGRGPQASALLLAFFEAMESGAYPRIQWTNGCNNALTYRLSEQWQPFESFFAYGVRYIALHEIGGSIELRDLRVLKATCIHLPLGAFQTDELLFAGVHRIATQTIESGTDDTFTDCPTFEQVNWNFDNRLASCADFLTGGNYDITRNSILLFAEDQEYRGMVASQTPSCCSLRIPLWSFHWIFWCWDYYWYTGDTAFLLQVFPRVCASLDEALRQIGDRGLMEMSNVWHFVEWGHGRDDDHAINSAEQAAFLEALRIGNRMARVLNTKRDFATACDVLKRAINRHLWDAKKGYYRDSIHHDGKSSAVSSQATNAMLGLYGAGTVRWSADLATKLINGCDALLAPGSPYGFYYLLELLDRHDHCDVILDWVGQRWGEMLTAGDGTTWETFAEFGQGSWPTRSRCHPFAAYVVKYLIKYILGLEILAPGFTRVRIRPRAPSHIKRASGTIPTPQGPLRVAWSRKRGGFDLHLESPRAIQVVGK